MVKNRRDTITYSKATLACVCLLVGMIVLYLYFLNMSVVQVVMRTDYVKQQNDLGAELAILDAKYIETQHVIASRIATMDNYNTSAEKIFVSREQPSLVFGSR